MSTARRLLLPLLASAAVLAGTPCGGLAPRVWAEEGHAAPASRRAPDLETGIRRAVAYLVESQRKDGSWGSTASTLSDIFAPQPGSSHAFQAAASALALSALLEDGGDAPGQREAIRRGTEWLVRHHAVKRVSVETLYNVWAHAYSLEAFARLLAREEDPARRDVFLREAAVDVERLATFRFAEGGWGYYDFDLGGRRPGPGSTSFTTATVLVALQMAKEQGVKVPAPLWKGGLHLVRVLRFPRGSWAYSYDHRYYPQGGINKVKGSLARTPACLLALRMCGQPAEATDEHLATALDDLEREGHFLQIARKYPVPHETWYQNSGYFAFYGYYYASRCLERLPPGRRDRHRAEIAARLLPLQEQDGSFWDYQLFGYHKAYGTGYVLMTLLRCRPGAPAPLEAPKAGT